MTGVADGSRNATATKIAGYWINKLPPSDTLAILKSWNQNNEPPLPDRYATIPGKPTIVDHVRSGILQAPFFP